jgi:transposase
VEDAAPTSDRRVLPLGIRRAIVALKAEYPSLGPFAIARICRHRFDRPVGYHTVQQVLDAEPAPLPFPAARRFRRYHDEPDPVARRNAVVTLYLEGWRPTAIAGYLGTSRQTVPEVLRRWDAEGWPGLADRPLGPRQPARKVDLRAMAAIRRLQANPELGEFRIHAALAQQGIDLSPRTCGRILALHRELYGLRKLDRAPRCGGTSSGRSTSATSKTTGSGPGNPSTSSPSWRITRGRSSQARSRRGRT